jgi:hypothetical protein
MRRVWLIGITTLSAVGSSCSSSGACHDLGSNVCLTLRLTGTVPAPDQITVNVTSPTGTVRTAQTGLISPVAMLPVDLPVLLPDETGSSFIEVVGLSAAGATLARGTASVTVPPKIQSVTVNLVVPRSRYAASGFVTTARPSTTTSSSYRLADDGFELDTAACSVSGYCVTGGLSP